MARRSSNGNGSNGSAAHLGFEAKFWLSGCLLRMFTNAEEKNGAHMCTHNCVVRLLVEMLEPYKGPIYDPCCRLGGMFVQSERFVKANDGKIGDIAVYECSRIPIGSFA